MCSHGHTTHLLVWITLKKLWKWTWMIIDRLHQPILCKWEMLELGKCPSWVDLTQSNQIRDLGEAIFGSRNCQKLPINQIIFIFLWKERQRTWEEKLFEKKWKTFVLWNEVLLDFIMIPFTTEGENLNDETTLFFFLDFSKDNPKIYNNNFT